MAIADHFLLIKNKGKGLLRRVFEKKPVHMLHIGKTGGTAVNSVLKTHLNSGRFRIVLHEHHAKFRDIPRGERTVFFLRDPLKRFVSSFYSRQRQGQPRYFSPWNEGEKIAFEYFETPDQLARALSSSEEDKKTRALNAMNSIFHVNTQYWDWFENPDYCKSRIHDIFFVGFQERLSEDFNNLKKKLGIPEGAALPTDDTEAHRSPRSLNTRLSDEAVNNLKAWYRSDYEFIDFCCTDILNNRQPKLWLRLKSMLHH